jgi:catechol 2,3-dioxygenase-like lactoylglutathione lyase family enzyme
MIRGIHHVAISTSDLARAIAFYRDLFGFEVVMEFDWPVGTEQSDRIMGLEGSSGRAAVLRGTGGMLEIFEFRSPAPRPGDPARPVCDHGLTHLCVEVRDIAGEYQRLRRAGMAFHCPPQDIMGGHWATYGRDPDGNVIELLEITDPDHPMALRP